jgi:PAS domain-containing protein
MGGCATHREHRRDGELRLLDILARQAADFFDRRRAREALRQSEERLRVALAAGAMGTWVCRVATDGQLLDESMRRLAGLPPDADALPLDAFLRIVYDEDRSFARRA